jgi:hypothetical protein
MRTRLLVACAAAILCLSSLAPAAQAATGGDPARERPRHAPHTVGADDATVVAGDAYVRAGEVHDADIVAVGGVVRVEGTVTGDVVVIFGTIEVDGSIEGDVVSVMSRCTLGDGARIDGELVNVGWGVERAPGSQVKGAIVNLNFMSFVPFAGRGGGWSGLLRLWFLFRLACLAAFFVILLLITALVPRRLEVIAAAFPRRWGWSILAGLAAYAASVIGCTFLALTFIGIPLAIALGFAMLVIKWVGLASILYLIGTTAGRNLFKRDLSHLAAALGGFAAYALLILVPFFGMIFGMVVNVLAVGIVLVTRFGAEEPWGISGAAAAGPEPAPPPVVAGASD